MRDSLQTSTPLLERTLRLAGLLAGCRTRRLVSGRPASVRRPHHCERLLAACYLLVEVSEPNGKRERHRAEEAEADAKGDRESERKRIAHTHTYTQPPTKQTRAGARAFAIALVH